MPHFWEPRTLEQRIAAAHFGANFLSAPCAICGEVTYCAAWLERRAPIYLCKRRHWNIEGLRTVMERGGDDADTVPDGRS
jgi:hypothetical protein